MLPIFKAASSLILAFFDERCEFRRARTGVPNRMPEALSPSAKTFNRERIKIRIDSSFSKTSLSTSVGIMPVSITLSTPKRNSARLIKLTYALLRIYTSLSSKSCLISITLCTLIKVSLPYSVHATFKTAREASSLMVSSSSLKHLISSPRILAFKATLTLSA